MKSLSHVQLFVTPWTVAYQTPPSMGFSRQEYWSGLPFPSPGDLPNSGIELPNSGRSPALWADALPSEPPRKSSDLLKRHEITSESHTRNSLPVQWLELCASTAGGLGSIPGGGIRSCKPHGQKQTNEKPVSWWSLGELDSLEDISLCIFLYYFYVWTMSMHYLLKKKQI